MSLVHVYLAFLVCLLPFAFCKPDQPDCNTQESVVMSAAASMCAQCAALGYDTNPKPDTTHRSSTIEPGTTPKATELLLVKSEKTWSEASHHCYRLGGNLVSIHSQADQNKAVDHLIRHSGQGGVFWIGLNDRNTEGRFEWADKTSVSYLNWYPNSPSKTLSGGEDDDCVSMFPPGGRGSNYMWSDQDCSYTYRFLCSV